MEQKIFFALKVTVTVVGLARQNHIIPVFR